MKRFVRWRERAPDEKNRRGSPGLDTVFVALAAVFGAAAMAWLFVLRAASVAAVNEDAFISFRYARNLLSGEGLVFNSGDRVEGITNLLWTLLLAGASWTSGLTLPETSTVLGISFGALAAIAAFAWCFAELRNTSLSRPLAAPIALAAPLLVTVAPGFAFYSASGLETPLFAFLLVSGLFLLSRNSSSKTLPALGGFVLGLAAMTRPEGVLALAFGVIGRALIPRGVSLGERFSRFLVAGLPGAAVVGGFTVWRLLYYGSPIPNTAYAKAGGVEVVERWGIPYLMEAAQGNWFVIAWLAVFAGALLDRRFLSRSLAVLALVPVWAVYVVYVGGDYMPFHRLVVPILPVLFALAVAGFVRVAYAMPKGESSSGGRAAASVVLAAALAFPFLAGVPDQFEREEKVSENRIQTTERRMEMAAWFRENAPDALIARNGVGVFAYYSRAEIVDMLGLTDEHIARSGNKHPRALPGHQASDAEYILDREPDYIMLAEGGPNPGFASDRELVNNPRLREEYDRVRIEVANDREISVLRRDDGETGENASR